MFFVPFLPHIPPLPNFSFFLIQTISIVVFLLKYLGAPRKGLEGLLKVTGEFNPNVIPRMRRRFSGQVLQAVNEQLPDLAREIYYQTESLPQTTTEQHFSVQGYLLNGLWHTGNDAFVVCYKGTMTYLLKALTEKGHRRAVALQDRLNGDLNQYVTSFEVQSHGSKNFMIMPFYTSTLETVRKLSVDDGRRVVQQVSEALLFLHEKGFIHMDVKPSNLCLTENGDVILVDLGSVVPRSTPSQLSTSESTVVYVPKDFQPRPHNNQSDNKYIAEDFVGVITLLLHLCKSA
jgi:serine/threonine protein kinase